MSIPWKKYKIFLLLAILLVFFSVISFFGVRYLMKEIDANNENIKKEIVDFEERQKRLAEISELRNRFEMVKKGENKFGIILSQSQMIVLIKKLEEIAEGTENEMIIEDMEIKNEEDEIKVNKKASKKNESGGKKLSVDLTGDYASMKIKLRGSYNNALNFIEKMESMNYCADIISLQLLVEKNDAVNRSSGTLLSVNPFVGRGSTPDNNNRLSETEVEVENAEKVIIDSVLDVVVYFNE